MKAAIVREFNKISIEELPKPEIRAEEALVEVEYAGICGTDIHVYEGLHPAAKLPVILGHEFVGKLVEISTVSETGLKIEEYVLVQPFTSCGICDLCVQGKDNICSKLKIFGIHDHGCFAEFIKVPVCKVYHLPSNIDLKLATLVEPLAVAVHDVERSNLRLGQTAFIIGAGPIGILIAMVARLSGASEIVMSEINEYRIKFAQELGFTVIDPKKIDIIQEVLNITSRKGFDVIYEVSGKRQGADLMTKTAKIGGTIIIVGVPTDKYPVDTGNILSKELEIKGVRLHTQINFAAAIRIIKSGIINDQLSRFITNEFSLNDIEEALKFSIKDQRHFKVLLRVH